MRTRIKICGITRTEDAREAVRLGVDAIGLVFYQQSPRAVSIEQAQQIVSVLPPFVAPVGLFVDAGQQHIEDVLAKVPLGLLQFHGDEPPEACQLYRIPYIKALRVRSGLDIVAEIVKYEAASGLLLDTYQPGVPGGTGQAFDWSGVPDGLKKPIILAGGLVPGNVVEAILTVHPYAVDVSGGVEAARGIKDAVKLAQFIAAVHKADTILRTED